MFVCFFCIEIWMQISWVGPSTRSNKPLLQRREPCQLPNNYQQDSKSGAQSLTCGWMNWYLINVHLFSGQELSPLDNHCETCILSSGWKWNLLEHESHRYVFWTLLTLFHPGLCKLAQQSLNDWYYSVHRYLYIKPIHLFMFRKVLTTFYCPK